MDAATLTVDCENRMLNKSGRGKTEAARMEKKLHQLDRTVFGLQTEGCQLPCVQLWYKHTYSVGGWVALKTEQAKRPQF